MKRYHGPFQVDRKTEIIIPGGPLQRVSTFNVGTASEWTFVGPGYIPDSTRYLSSQRAPGFRKLVADGWIIQSPFTTRKIVYAAVPGSFLEYTKAGTAARVTNSYTNLCAMYQDSFAFEFSPGNPEKRSAAHIEALARAFAKVHAGNADLLIDISQYRSTVQMFVKLAKTLIALMSNPKSFIGPWLRATITGETRYVRIPPRGRKVPVSSLEGLWCELRFGWGPLLGSLEGVVEALNRTDLDVVQRLTYRASEPVTYVDQKVTYNSYNWTSGGLVITDAQTRRWTEEIKYSAAIRSGVLVEEAISAYRALGLDARAIPIALWDAIPLSFIVDRFVNVGNWIRSLHPIPAQSFGGAWVSERYTVEHRLRTDFLPLFRTYGSGSTYRSYELTSGYEEGSVEHVGHFRTIHDSPPTFPTLRHDWSELQNLYNLVDAIMLVIQRTRPRHTP